MKSELTGPAEDTKETALVRSSNSTPTQLLRDQLTAFRFNDESTPSLRRSPRNYYVRQALRPEESKSELPTAGGSSLNKRSASAVFARSGSKKAKGDGRKTPRTKPKVAPPEKYAHLNSLNDYLGEEPDMLDVLFCGINPGQRSATVGHHFAHPTNHFWRCLHGAHLTDRLLSATEDYTLPDTYRLGLTNLVDRPSAQAAELAESEFTAGVPALLQKIVRKRPRIVCFVGKAIWDSFIKAAAPSPIFGEEAVTTDTQATEASLTTTTEAAASGELVAVTKTRKATMTKERPSRRKAKPIPKTFAFDLQPYKIVHTDPSATVRETLFFVVVSTSGLVAGYQLPEKIEQFALLKQRLNELEKGNVDTSTMSIIPISDILRHT
ncbi:uracil-DNA glycosylase-like protein [Trametes punicea]|nr:uracil-DNA glycosylase-like protein [Trametes punicea]